MHDPEHLKLMRLYDMELFERSPAEFTQWALKEIERQQELVARFVKPK